MDVPTHLLQPLCVDTNMTYSLDMTLFPGLDDPQHMYQPALLIANDWSQYIADDLLSDVNTDEEDLSFHVDDDLFSLIECCDDLISNFKPDSSTDEDLVDSLLGDAIPESACEENRKPFDAFLLKETSSDDGFTEIVTSAPKGKKRLRLDTSNYPVAKKSRMEEPLLDIHSLVLLHATFDSCVLHRES